MVRNSLVYSAPDREYRRNQPSNPLPKSKETVPPIAGSIGANIGARLQTK